MEHLWIQSHLVDWDDLADGEGLKVFATARDCTLTDIHGRNYLDGLAGLFVVTVGHGRESIGQAMAVQAKRVAYVAASRFSTAPTIELAETLSNLLGGQLGHTHFCSSGSEANETAFKIARQAQAMRGFSGRHKIIARNGGYHGATFGAMSVTSTRNEEYFGPFMPGVSFVPSPNRYRNDFDLDGEAGDLMCAQALVDEIERQGPETVAAVIGEPISGSNGVHLPTPEYWKIIRDACDRYGIFLIFDEVVTGFGRTGRMFGYEHFGVMPDMMTIAKGLTSGYAPMGAVLTRSSVFDDFKPSGASLSHLLTFGGHPVSAAAANKNLEILIEENLAQQSAEKGSYLASRLTTLLAHPTVGDVRGVGLLCGIELVKNKSTKDRWGGPRSGFIKSLQMALERRGLLTRAWDVLFLSPPLVITLEEIDRMVETIDESLTEVESDFEAEIEI